MRPFASIAASAVGAGVTGAAAGLLTLSALQANMPALMAHLMKPTPELGGRRVLLCTGEADHRIRGTAADEAQQWRRALESEHDASVILVDLRTDSRCSARRRAQVRALAASVPADHQREFVLGGANDAQVRTSAAPESLPAIR
ncbi:hypothetical protein M3E18_11395 [Kocuria sp. p3-SID1433]|uniref:hypothetical protein n=1 Tax=unclassified Kocuria TaxID=2649579 RepID=UPI0021A2E944|nr:MULTISPECIES: hypothetical protein [unclassified Kocuria]MCT1603006.1 hypothetical protein [Kocuria sp. p3-SID1428]MCT2181127.1 hypothetical protein [Kocuria sp. p3-SID1433]